MVKWYSTIKHNPVPCKNEVKKLATPTRNINQFILTNSSNQKSVSSLSTTLQKGSTSYSNISTIDKKSINILLFTQIF